VVGRPRVWVWVGGKSRGGVAAGRWRELAPSQGGAGSRVALLLRWSCALYTTVAAVAALLLRAGLLVLLFVLLLVLLHLAPVLPQCLLLHRSHIHARTHAHTHAHTHTLSLSEDSVAVWVRRADEFWDDVPLHHDDEPEAR
jgi:hypothetical protein